MPQLEAKHFTTVLENLPVSLKLQLQMNPKRLILAGGFIRELVAGYKPRDIDIFAGNEGDAKKFSAEYAESHPSGEKPWRSEHAYNFKAGNETPIQWVFAVPFVYDYNWEIPSLTILNSFDFAMSKVAVWFDRGDWQTECDNQFYSCVNERRLGFQASSRDFQSLRALKRAFKFVARGWKISDDEITKIIMSFDPNVTEKQVRDALSTELYKSGNATRTAPEETGIVEAEPTFRWPEVRLTGHVSVTSTGNTESRNRVTPNWYIPNAIRRSARWEVSPRTLTYRTSMNEEPSIIDDEFTNPAGETTGTQGE